MSNGKSSSWSRGTLERDKTRKYAGQDDGFSEEAAMFMTVRDALDARTQPRTDAAMRSRQAAASRNAAIAQPPRPRAQGSTSSLGSSSNSTPRSLPPNSPTHRTPSGVTARSSVSNLHLPRVTGGTHGMDTHGDMGSPTGSRQRDASNGGLSQNNSQSSSVMKSGRSLPGEQDSWKDDPFDARLAMDIHMAQQSGTFDISMRGLTEIAQQLLRYFRVEGRHISKACLQGNQLTLHPPYTELLGLASLNLSANLLASMPDNISCLVKLTELQVSQNRLTTLPDLLGSSLTALVRLDLSKNTLVHLPENMGALVHLQGLQVDHNELSHLPASLFGLVHLESLSASHNHLVGLSHGVNGLVSLTSLSLHHNHMTALPTTLGGVTHLEDLRLHDNELFILPRELAYLTAITKLTTGRNPLIYPPRGVCKVGPAAVREFLATNAGFMSDGSQLHDDPLPAGSMQAQVAEWQAQRARLRLGGDEDEDGSTSGPAAVTCERCKTLMDQAERAGVHHLALQLAMELAERELSEKRDVLLVKEHQVTGLTKEVQQLELERRLIEESLAVHGTLHLASRDVFEKQTRSLREEIITLKVEKAVTEERLAEHVLALDDERRHGMAAAVIAGQATRNATLAEVATADRDAALVEAKRVADELAQALFHLRCAQDLQTRAESQLDLDGGLLSACQGEVRHVEQELQVTKAAAEVVALEGQQRERLLEVEIERLKAEVAALTAERLMMPPAAPPRPPTPPTVVTAPGMGAWRQPQQW